MRNNSVESVGQNSVQSTNIPYSKIPNQTKLFLEFQENSASIKGFYPDIDTPLPEFARQVIDNYAVDRDALCDTLLETNKQLGGKIKTFINIEYLRQNDCVAVVTGQQAGLFTGPAYTFYKALSAVKMAKGLREQNINAVPVFWIAEEDHDFEEVKKARILDSSGKLVAIENNPRSYKTGAPVGFVKLDRKIEDSIDELFAALGHTEFSAALRNQIGQSYRAGESYSSAFGRLLLNVLSDYGLIVISPLDRRLKDLCSPIFASAVEQSLEINNRLLDRGRMLEAAGFHSQVLVEENSFPFFLQKEGGERLSMRRELETGQIRIQDSHTVFEESELLQMARREPQYLSPNALLRPVVQDYLLPTIAYFGGAAEIAYFAQNSVIYESLKRPVTPILHRAGFTVIPGQHARTLNRYDLGFGDLFSGREKIAAHIVERYLANDTALIFAETEAVISTQLNRLEKNLLETEPTLAANLENRRKKIDWHLNTLRKKYQSSEINKNEIAARRIETLFTALLPNGSLQERAVSAVTFLNLFGSDFFRWIYDTIDFDREGHQVITL